MLPEPPIEPQTDETSGKHSQMATYTDLLRTPADEDTFEALATTVPCRVDPLTGARQELGPPGLYQGLNDSPDGTHLLVHRLQRPFSFRVPWQLFAGRVEVWDRRRDAGRSDRRPPGERRGAEAGRADRAARWSLGGAGAGQPGVGGGPRRRRPGAPRPTHRDRVLQPDGAVHPGSGPVKPVTEPRQHRCLGWSTSTSPARCC